MEKKNIVSFRSGGAKMYLLPLIMVTLRDGISNPRKLNM